MPNYYMVLDAAEFHQRIRPILGDCCRQRSFEPSRTLCTELAPKANSFAEGLVSATDDALVCRVLRDLPFDRNLWINLVGEILLYSAVDLPEIHADPQSLCWLLAPRDRVGKDPAAKDGRTPIEQALYGARDLAFGGRFYRPEHAGYNDTQDVARLACYLTSIETNQWSPADLEGLPDLIGVEDQSQELECVRDWLADLRGFYQRAQDFGRIIVCESS